MQACKLEPCLSQCGTLTPSLSLLSLSTLMGGPLTSLAHLLLRGEHCLGMCCLLSCALPIAVSLL